VGLLDQALFVGPASRSQSPLEAIVLPPVPLAFLRVTLQREWLDISLRIAHLRSLTQRIGALKNNKLDHVTVLMPLTPAGRKADFGKLLLVRGMH
jgi:hypothetical protein